MNPKKMKRPHVRSIFVLMFIIGYAHTACAIKLGAPKLVADLSDASEVYYYIAAGNDSSIHVVYNGKYRSGTLAGGFGDEETISDSLIKNPKIDIDPLGNVHLVFTRGGPKGRGDSHYTVRKNGNWIPIEKVASSATLDGANASIPDVAADSLGNVLICFAAGGSPYENAVYCWRSPEGIWGGYLGDLSTYHAATPKVEEHNGGFYLHYAASDFDKRLSGPFTAGAVFDSGIQMSTDVGGAHQNEGTNFTIAANGDVAACGNRRHYWRDVDTANPVNSFGIWASDNQSGTFVPQMLSPEWPGNSGDESAYHPMVAIDDATGNIVVVVQAKSDGKPYYAVKENGTWSQTTRLYPEEDVDTWEWWSIRNGPSVTDVPGPGVVALFRCYRKLYVRMLYPDDEEDVLFTSLNNPPTRNSQARQKMFLTMGTSSGGVHTVIIHNLPLGYASIAIYSMSGKRIMEREIMNYDHTPAAQFTLMNNESTRLGDGVYIFRVRCPGENPGIHHVVHNISTK